MQKHPQRHTQNSVWLHVQAPCGPVNLMYKVNHHNMLPVGNTLANHMKRCQYHYHHGMRSHSEHSNTPLHAHLNSCSQKLQHEALVMYRNSNPRTLLVGYKMVALLSKTVFSYKI